MGASQSSNSSTSGSSNSSGSKYSSAWGSSRQSHGGDWTHEIYFDPEADKVYESSYKIKDTELIRKLATLVDTNEKIIKVQAYKVPIFEIQLTSFTMYHLFIVFETQNWYWSIEKHTDGITIQRSKSESAVKDRYRQKDRLSPSLVKEDSGGKSVKDLIHWLNNEKELNKPYNAIFSNCKTFAKRVFDHVARNTYLYWFDGAIMHWFR